MEPASLGHVYKILSPFGYPKPLIMALNIGGFKRIIFFLKDFNIAMSNSWMGLKLEVA